MKKAGRIISVLLVAAMMITTMFAVSGCGGGSDDSSQIPSNTKSGENQAQNGLSLKKDYKIGVISFDYANQQGKDLKRMLDYLGKEFGVEIVYATAQPVEAEIIKATEDLSAAGVDGILNLMWNKKAFEVAAENEVYMARIFNTILGKDAGPGDEGYDDVKSSPYFVGSTSPDLNTASYGEEAAKVGIDAGLDNFAAIGFPRFWLPFNDQMLVGFIDYAKKQGINAIDANPDEQFGPDDVFRLNPMGDVAAQMSTFLSSYPNAEYVFATSSGMDLVYPSIINAGLKDTLKLGILSYQPGATLEGFKDGSIIFALDPVNSTMAALGFAMLIDKMEGNAYDDAPEFPENIETNIVIMKSAADAERHERLVLGDNLHISADELKHIMKTFNENATYADLKAYASDASDLDKIEAKSGK